MGFISKEERISLVKKINQSYVLKKVLLLIEIVALIAFIAVIFISWWMVNANGDNTWSWVQNGQFTTLGIAMLVYAAVIAALGIICVILIFTMQSPKKVTQENKTLLGAAVGGKKVHKLKQSANDIMKQRSTLKKNKLI